VVNAAMRGIDSHVVRRIALDCAKHDPDLFIVYAGNNEVVGLHGPEPGSSRISQWLPLIRTSQWLKSTKIGQLTKRLVGGRASSRAETQDMEFFRKKRLWAGDPRRAAVHRNFQSNLEDICRAAARAKANVVLSTVPVNLKDFPPLGSVHPPRLSPKRVANFEKVYSEAIRAEAQGSNAIPLFLEAAKIDPQFAELHFRLARNLLAKGEMVKAQEEYESARNLDALQFRADRLMNDMVRKVVGHGIALADTEHLLPESELSDHGIPGAKLFRDHVHPTFDGDYLLARSLFPVVTNALKLGKRAGGELPSREECATALAYTQWHDVQIQAAIVDLSSRPPFHDQVDYRERQAAAEAEVKQRLANLREPEVRRSLETCVAAARARPNDWLLHYNCATLFQALGNYSGAVEQLQALATMFPEVATFRLVLGQALARAGRTDAAAFEFQEAARLDPEDPAIHDALAQLRKSR